MSSRKTITKRIVKTSVRGRPATVVIDESKGTRKMTTPIVVRRGSDTDTDEDTSDTESDDDSGNEFDSDGADDGHLYTNPDGSARDFLF